MSQAAARPLLNLGTAAAAFLILGWAPELLHLPLQLQFDAALSIIYGFALLSLVLLTGYVGQVSLCQATFVGIGAYTTAWSFNVFHLPYPLAMLLGVAAAAVIGVLIGIPALRLRGIMLAIVTLGVALVFDRYFFIDRTFSWWTNGYAGWRVNGITLAHVQMDWLNHLPNIYRFALLLFLAVALLLVNIHGAGSGRRFRAIRDSELAAATMGVDLTRYKLVAFGLAAAIAGLGGSLFPLASGQVSAQPFDVFYSLQLAAVAVLVGVRYVPAAVVGGFFTAFMPTLLSDWHPFRLEIRYDWFQVVLGALLVIQLITAPDGVWGDLHRHWRSLTQRLDRSRQPRVEIAT